MNSRLGRGGEPEAIIVKPLAVTNCYRVYGSLCHTIAELQAPSEIRVCPCQPPTVCHNDCAAFAELASLAAELNNMAFGHTVFTA